MERAMLVSPVNKVSRSEALSKSAQSISAESDHVRGQARSGAGNELHAPDPITAVSAKDTSAPVSELLIGRRALAVWADALDELLAAIGAPPATWWTALDVWLSTHPDHEAWAVVVRSGQRLDAAMVLSRRPRLGVWVVERVGARGEPGWLAARDAAAERALADGVVSALCELRRPWVLYLLDLPSPCFAVDALQAALRVTRVEPGPLAPYVPFEPDTTIRTYLSRNTRSAVAKARNRVLRERSSLEVRWTDEADTIQRCLPEILDVYRARNIQLHGESDIDDPREAATIIAMIRDHALRRRAWLLTVRIDMELAAFAICFVSGGTMWVYRNLASPAWLRYSPGTIANTEVVRRAYADPTIHTVDWGAGVQRYKVSGHGTLRRSQHLYAWSSRPVRLAWNLRQQLHKCRPMAFAKRLSSRDLFKRAKDVLPRFLQNGPWPNRNTISVPPRNSSKSGLQGDCKVESLPRGTTGGRGENPSQTEQRRGA